MKYAVNSKIMKLIDDYTINVMKVPETVLMERAANEVVAVMKRQIKKEDRILAVCGPGNNGGDGIAAGRILYLQGYHVAILLVGNENKTSNGLKAQLEIARNLGITIENYNKLHEYNIIIDAIFGVGLGRAVTGEYEVLINTINNDNNTVYSVDIPSGISADNGKILNAAIKADYTITFGYLKQGLILYPGADLAGKITVADIGFPDASAIQARPEAFYYEREDLKKLPIRKNYSNKGTYGKVLIIAGSKGMSGAAYLSAKAAYRSGAGLVKVLTSKENRIILQTSLPEALFSAYDEESFDADTWKQMILSNVSWASAIVIGPGLGTSQTSHRLLEMLLEYAKVPVIIDADGINLLAKILDDIISKKVLAVNNSELKEIASKDSEITNDTIQRRLDYLSSFLSAQTILTPHIMELSRLLGILVADIVDNLVDTACQCSYNNNLIYAIKDARTIVTHNGLRYLNVSGNSGMATGGSGDVLTGIIAALIAQGMLPNEATCLGVYIHGLAGDEAARAKGQYSMMASDIVNSIENVLQMTKEFDY